MNPQLLYEIIGYTASFLVALSMAMNSLFKLRVANLIGAICFTTYGLLIGAYPIAAVNSFIAVVNSLYLYRMLNAHRYLTLLELPAPTPLLQHFLNVHEKALRKAAPDFVYVEHAAQLRYIMLDGATPVGLLIIEPTAPESAQLALDFIIPSHRSAKAARFIYNESVPRLREKGIFRLTSEAATPKHARALQGAGFTPQPADNGKTLYTLALTTENTPGAKPSG